MKKLAFLFLLVLVCPAFGSEILGNGCAFERAVDQASLYRIPADLQSVSFGGYLQVYYSAGDQFFASSDPDSPPDILQQNRAIFERTRHFIETELGWRLPATRVDSGRPELAVYFVPARKRFTGTTVGSAQSTQIIFNENVLESGDFPAIWIHQVAHAVELQYRVESSYWFSEALAGWLEGQFENYSAATLTAQSARLQHPEISLTDPSAVAALGVSRFMEMLSRPDRDVIRQILEQKATARDESMITSISAVLALNHMPDLDSYLQNYFLLFSPNTTLDTGRTPVDLQPYSAAVVQDVPAHTTRGGINLTFSAENGTPYSAAVVFYATGEKSGTMAMKKAASENWSIAIPYAGLDRYRFVVVNSNRQELLGRLEKAYDPTVPGVLEYFRVVPGDGGIVIEWKTSKEDGVAFWNLYRIENGKKELLNDYPIPAAINSDEGIHYMYLDQTAASFYTLDAVTSEGFESPFASSETSQ